MAEPYKIGISYSWDDEEHKKWVLGLATRLRSDGLNAILDQLHLGLGTRLPQFMEELIRESRFVLVIGTQDYKDRFDLRKGGTGYEGHIISARILSEGAGEKFIPVLRSGDWTTSLPTALAAIVGADLRGNPYIEDEYKKLVSKLHGIEIKVPPIGQAPEWLSSQSALNSPRQSGSAPNSMSAWLEQSWPAGYFRSVLLWSEKPLDHTPSELFQASQKAILHEVAWPISLYWHRHTGGDQFVKRQILQDGIQMDYFQHDALVYRAERLKLVNPGKIEIRETQEFPSRYPNGGFPYDTTIGTTAEAIRFGVKFFRAIGLSEKDEIGISLSWNGLKGRFITANTVRILSSYEQKRSEAETCSSRAIRFPLGDGETFLADHVRKLLGGLFSQFDLFDPNPQIFDEILEHWKGIAV